MKNEIQSSTTFTYDGIVYLNLSILKKSELRVLNQMPVGHSTLICDDFYTKVHVFNPMNPPRDGFSMVLMSDHPKLIEKQREKQRNSLPAVKEEVV